MCGTKYSEYFNFLNYLETLRYKVFFFFSSFYSLFGSHCSLSFAHLSFCVFHLCTWTYYRRHLSLPPSSSSCFLIFLLRSCLWFVCLVSTTLSTEISWTAGGRRLESRNQNGFEVLLPLSRLSFSLVLFHITEVFFRKRELLAANEKWISRSIQKNVINKYKYLGLYFFNRLRKPYFALSILFTGLFFICKSDHSYFTEQEYVFVVSLSLSFPSHSSNRENKSS